MPCTYTGSLEGDRAYFAQQALIEQEHLLAELTQALCEAVNTFRKAQVPMPPKVAAFAKKHDRVDAKRKAKEQKEKLRKQKIAKAKAKLTKEEKELLGVE